MEWIIIIIAFYISISNTNDDLFIIGSSLTLLLIYRISNKIITLSWFDIGVLLLWIYGFIGNITSINFINSFVDFKMLTISILSYFMIRSKFKDDKDVKNLLLSYSIIIGILIIISLISFFIFSEQIYSIGFDNLYSFRFKYRPLGNIPNVWATLLLAFWGIISLSMYYYRNNNTALCILFSLLLINAFGIIISFSRGIYLAFFISGILYFILITWSKMKILKKASLLVLMILPIIIFIISYNEEVFQTINFNKTASQQRSIAGRIDAIKSTKDVILGSPLIGVGTGNYSLAINTNRYEDDNNDYTSFAPNGFIQLVVEQGIIGFCLWTILLIILLIQFFQKIIIK